MIRRGGNIEWEIEHGKLLRNRGAGSVWGWDSPAGRARVERRTRWIADVCGLKPGVRVLECGCGTGIFTRELAKTGATIVAGEISPDLLEEAAKNCQVKNVRFVRINLEDPSPLRNNSFDAMYGVSILHHLNLSKALPALVRKLRPGGRFAFSEPNMLNPINRYIVFVNDPKKRKALGVSPNEMAFRPEELCDLLEKCGLVVEKLLYRDFLHPKVPRILIPFVNLVQVGAERLPLIRSISGSLWVYGTRPL
jgi:SAM-dependent methyltransferase